MCKHFLKYLCVNITNVYLLTDQCGSKVFAHARVIKGHMNLSLDILRGLCWG